MLNIRALDENDWLALDVWLTLVTPNVKGQKQEPD